MGGGKPFAYQWARVFDKLLATKQLASTAELTKFIVIAFRLRLAVKRKLQIQIQNSYPPKIQHGLSRKKRLDPRRGQ